MTLLSKFLRKNPAKRVGQGDPSVPFFAQDRTAPLSPGTEGPQAGLLIQRRADKMRGNRPINETRAYRRIHSILAEGPNNG